MWHWLHAFNGRLVVLGVPQVAQQGRVGVVFEEGMVSGMEEADDDDVDGSVLEVVVVVVFDLPSPSLLLVSFSVVLLDCIGTTEDFDRVRDFFV